MPIASLEYGKNGKPEKSAQRSYNVKTTVLIFLAEDGSDIPPLEFSPKTAFRRGQVGKKVTNNFFRQLWQLAAGKHIIGLPSIRVSNKMPHPTVGWFSRNQAYFGASGAMCSGNYRVAPAGKAKDSNFKTGQLKRLYITKEPAAVHFRAELLE